MIGLLNSGLSGFSLGHSDIGGYTAVNEPIVPKYLRDKQILYRWIEMTTFSDPIMRSHPSSAPDTNF
jgi:alpha-glucosidase